ncbi:hypothetical protein PILCRDRAFT_821230 [Piloderma croceum F 1598]|uniref:DUF6534 domain-containing protein n=1 Tax=Piloderma croceum (strain F 1598) TaxID=765440 RepID=A0A0C3FB26_PILCF|nr:hypothetical protein PILCRDRAFT_821230 [Piloderma croceum F 1598]
MSKFNPNLVEVELASGFIGFIISLWLYGATVSQSIFYFRSFPGDNRATKYLVSFLFFADTLHVYLLSHMFWNFLVYGRSVGFIILLRLPWQLTTSFIVGWVVTTVVQCFFALRVWKVSNKNWIAVSVIGISSMAQLSAGMIFSAHLIKVGDPFSAFDHVGNLCGRTELVCSMVCDLVISVSLVYYFSVFRIGLERSNHLLRNLIILSLNMGGLLCLVTVITLILFEVEAGTFISLGPHFILSKLYVNSLLATLNSRKHLRALANRTIEISLPTIPDSIDVP